MKQMIPSCLSYVIFVVHLAKLTPNSSDATKSASWQQHGLNACHAVAYIIYSLSQLNSYFKLDL